MLIDFTVSNFLSIREKQTFSMVAAPRLGKKENVINPAIIGEKSPNLLKVAAIYGPNASGKSNFIKALSLISKLIKSQGKSPQTLLPVNSFRFDKDLTDKPSNFSVHFIINQRRYIYNLSLTSTRIMSEELVIFKRSKEYLLYSRVYSGEKYEYSFGSSLEGGSRVHKAWIDLTSPKMLFICQAVNNSNESLTQLRIPLQWLSESLGDIPKSLDKLISAYHLFPTSLPEQYINSYISNFLTELDIPISKVRFQNSEAGGILDFESFKNANSAEIEEFLSNTKTTLIHKTALGEAEFEFDEESDGTKNLAGFTLIWKILNIDTSMFCFVMDEIDSSLHPLIIDSLIRKFIKSGTSNQLIFTTHDTHLMNTKLLRRDQLWLVERDINGASQLRSIYDFEGREGEDIEKRYYEGRYRALPILD